MATNYSYHPCLLAFLSLSLVISSSCLSLEIDEARRGPYFDGMFVFGSSVIDAGNNEYIDTDFRVRYLPFGVDFPVGPTGRFSNGMTVADKIGQILGLPLIPPFYDPETKGHKILHGVNFGSAGSGILNHTGAAAGVVGFTQQVENFVEKTVPELSSILGRTPSQILSRYLILVAHGNNDFSGYFSQHSSKRPSVHDFVSNLISTYNGHLETLYDAGARKFALLTVYPVGCSPSTRESAGTQACVEWLNEAIECFNNRLITQVAALKRNMPGSHFVVVNTYNMLMHILKHPFHSGFINARDACCETIYGVCFPGGRLCKDRTKYVYFDEVHNTEALAAVLAAKAFASDTKTEVYPFNLKALASLETSPLLRMPI